MLEQLRKYTFPWKNGWSLLVIIAFVVSGNTILNTRKIYKKWNTLYHYDQAGYFAYLPAVFIYEKDFSFQFFDDLGFRSKEFTKEYRGIRINKYHTGPAVLLSPFYALGHILAQRRGAPLNGFSEPYKYLVTLGCLFYVTLALFFLRMLLLRYFSDPVTALTLLAIAIGTNLLYYSSHESLMSHAYSFFLFAGIIISGVRYVEDGKKWALLVTGLCAGLILATRLPNGLIFLVPLLWGVQRWKDLGSRLLQLAKDWPWVLGAVLLLLLGMSPQLAYAHAQTGQWFINAYEGEHFYFGQPLLGKILFSYRKGWLVYTPLMLLALMGFYWLKKYCAPAFWGTIIYLVLHLYLISCWGVWWYGGSFGMRTMVESYAVLSLPLASFLQALLQNGYGRYWFIALFPWMIGLNLLQTHQYSRGIIHHDSMSKKAYWTVFGRIHPIHPEVKAEMKKHTSFPNYKRANRYPEYRKAMD